MTDEGHLSHTKMQSYVPTKPIRAKIVSSKKNGSYFELVAHGSRLIVFCRRKYHCKHCLSYHIHLSYKKCTT